MPILSMFYGTIITMYYRDHNPPHIHVQYQNDKALVNTDGDVIEGALPKRQLRLVQAWVELHRDEILANWELAQEKNELYKIDPLK
ncbi:MAG: DUF4160 domain-containing protein [Defluviitaleaceae bacterium]|nr:DUF4160 domain-containing protein [Defluviitaleaceae bacterium]